MLQTMALRWAYVGYIYTMMMILVSLQIHAIQVFQHATISSSDVISSSGANKAYTPLGFQPDRTRGWLRLCWFAFNKAGEPWKPSVCERLVFHLCPNRKFLFHWSTFWSSIPWCHVTIYVRRWSRAPAGRSQSLVRDRGFVLHSLSLSFSPLGFRAFRVSNDAIVIHVVNTSPKVNLDR